MPEGVRRLSSSTMNRPSASRTMSSPATWVHTPPGTSAPTIEGSNCSAVSITRAGRRPALTIARSP